MRRVPIYFLLAATLNLFGAADGGATRKLSLLEIVDGQDYMNDRWLLNQVILLGDDFPSKEHPLYEALVAAIQKRDFNKSDTSGSSALHFAVQGSSIELMQILIAKGFCMEQPCENGRLPLHWAVYAVPEMLRYALNNTRDLDNYINLLDTSDKSRSPIHLLSRNIEGSVIKPDNKTPNRVSAERACANFRILKEYGADLNIPDGCWGKTVLHWSIYNPIQVMRTLLELGADPNAQDKDHKTVLDWLNMNKNSINDCAEKRELLRRCGAKRSAELCAQKALSGWIPSRLRERSAKINASNVSDRGNYSVHHPQNAQRTVTQSTGSNATDWHSTSRTNSSQVSSSNARR